MKYLEYDQVTVICITHQYAKKEALLEIKPITIVGE